MWRDKEIVRLSFVPLGKSCATLRGVGDSGFEFETLFEAPASPGTNAKTVN